MKVQGASLVRLRTGASHFVRCKSKTSAREEKRMLKEGESFVYTACPGWGDHDYCALKTIVKDGKIVRMEKADYFSFRNNSMRFCYSDPNDETVLHCYFTMPTDEMRNLWLACEETAIVDMATGVQYRAKRTAPECFRKHFSVKAPVGTALDFKIYFPKLAPTTKEIAIYGVPMWRMRGTKVQINNTPTFHGTVTYNYDNAPQIKKPTLVKEANNYNKDNHETWAVYTNPHLIKPVKEGTMALWNTPEATYIAIAHEQNWMRE